MDELTGRVTRGGHVRAALVDLGHGLALTGLTIVGALVLLWVTFAVTLVGAGIGLLLVPGALVLTRRVTGQHRQLVRRWSAVGVEGHYRALPPRRPGFVGWWRHTFLVLADPATWRDLLWLLVNPVVGPLMTLLPAVAVLDGVWGLCMPFMWRVLRDDWHWGNSWFAFIPLVNQTTAVLAAVLGAVEIVVGLALATPLLRAYGRWTRYMLGRVSVSALNDRVDHLSTSRSDAVNYSAAELTRIERDLHDGAQSRLVAMGMTLAAAENLMQRNPEAALALVAEAKDSSAAALRELRNLARGIHPPVLADRGLVDAVRARALESPIRVEVVASVPGRAPLPVESAVYFAVSELLTNAVKHSRAHRIRVELRHTDDVLRVEVRDDGAGGADPERGSGLQGITRRLSAFDGTVHVSSPPDGPTVVTLQLPCPIVQDLRG
jgi:signal transduction histidine kinase